LTKKTNLTDKKKLINVAKAKPMQLEIKTIEVKFIKYLVKQISTIEQIPPTIKYLTN